MRIRDMTEADIDAVAALRVRAWQFAYAGQVPQHHLDALSPEEDAARRREFFPESRRVAPSLVAEDGGELVGWAAWGAYRADAAPTTPREPLRPGADAELYALYVRPDRIGTGTGRPLMATALAHATAAGAPRMLLWVLRDNARARRFYEAAGFTADGEETGFAVGGTTVPEVRYVRRLR